MRASGRAADQLRPVRFTRRYTSHAEGSVLAEFGATRVLCTASVENGVPHFLRNSGRGWLTAEYGMLPRATHTRTRPRGGERPAGRAHAGNPAPDRQVAARLHRSRRHRRTHHHDRLRRAAGRRRHAHGRDHRRLRGARGCRGHADGPRPARAQSPARPDRGRLGRHRRRRRGARSRLRGGRGGRDRHECRDEFRRRLHRGAGHGRGPCVPARGTRRAAGSRGRRHRAGCAPCRTRRGRAEAGAADETRGARDRQSRQARRDARDPRRATSSKSSRRASSASSRPSRTARASSPMR